jgi:hypothetical protein
MPFGRTSNDPREELLIPSQKAEEAVQGQNYDGKMERTMMLKLQGKRSPHHSSDG